MPPDHLLQRCTRLVVLIEGPAGSGKSTLADAIAYTYAELHDTLAIDGRTPAFSIRRGLVLDRDFPVVDPQSGVRVASFDSGVDLDRREISSRFGVRRVSHADTLKQIAHDLFGVPWRCLYGPSELRNTPTHLKWERFPYGLRVKFSGRRGPSRWWRPATGLVTVRELLQLIGTDWFRRIDPDCHVRATKARLERLPGEDPAARRVSVVEDVRFDNESFLTEYGGLAAPRRHDVVRVRLLPGEGESRGFHASEKGASGVPDSAFDLVLGKHAYDPLEIAASHLADRLRRHPPFHRLEPRSAAAPATPATPGEAA